MSPRVEFKANVPTDVSLQFTEGRNIASKFGDGTQVMYTTVDGRVMFVSPAVAARIQELKPGPGALLRITKTEREGGGRGFDWRIEKLGKQPDGTFVIPAIPESQTGLASPLQNSTSPARVERKPQNIPTVTREQVLRKHSKVLIDMQAGLLKYAAEKHAGVVNSQDIRSIILTVYIQLAKGGIGARR